MPNFTEQSGTTPSKLNPMKMHPLLILGLILVLSCNSQKLDENIIDQKLELSVLGSNTTFEAGEVIELKLSINNLDGKLVQNSDKTDKIIDLKDFEKKITVICKNTGQHFLGPYMININNMILESNQVSVNIVEPSIAFGGIDTVISMAVPEVISKGEKFSIIIKSNILLNNSSQEKNINSLDDFPQIMGSELKVRKNSKIEQLSSSSSSSISVKDGNTKSEYIYTFEMLAKEKGVVEIGCQSFEPQLPIVLNIKVLEIK